MANFSCVSDVVPAPASFVTAIAALPVMQKLKFFGKVQAPPKVLVLLAVDMLRRRICVATNLIC